MMLELLEKEQLALAAVKQMGVKKANERLDALSSIAHARYREFLNCGSGGSGAQPFDFLTEQERAERHQLIVGITLTGYFSPQAAHERVVARRKRQLTQALTQRYNAA